MAISQRLISAEDDVAEARTEANHQAAYRAGFGHADTLRQQVVTLSKVMGDTRRLRGHMSRFDSHWRDAPQEQLFDAAEIRLDGLQRQLADQESHEFAAYQGTCSIPEIELALSLSRYETRFYRQLNRALNELERIQRRRDAAKRLGAVARVTSSRRLSISPSPMIRDPAGQRCPQRECTGGCGAWYSSTSTTRSLCAGGGVYARARG